MRVQPPDPAPAAALFLALALTLTPIASGQEPDDRFRRFDRNGDGKITREEAPALIRLSFDRIDADRDGAITRAEFDAFNRRVQAQRPGPAPRLVEGVELVADVRYAGTDNPRQRLDLLVPKRSGQGQGDPKPLPVIVYIHGGAWRGGDRLAGYPFLTPYVASGDYAGVTVGYRLTDEARWPSQVFDCKAAVRWVRANAAKYHLDPDRIGVIGPSAGGHLAAMLGTSGGVKELEGVLGPHRGVSSRVACVVDEFGPSDLDAMRQAPSRLDHASADSPEGRLIGGAVPDNPTTARDASPVTYVSADDPPFLIVHGTADDTVPFDQSRRLLAALKKAGVSALLIPVEGGGHGGFASPELNRRTRAFFDKHLLNRPAEIPDTPVPAGRRPGPPSEAPRPKGAP